MRPNTDRPRHWVSRALLAATFAGVPLLGAGLAAPAQPGPASGQPAPAVRLYIFDLGQLKSANPQPLLDRGVTITDMSVAAYLIVHPRGTLVWDTGTIPDELIRPGGTTVARATVHKTL